MTAPNPTPAAVKAALIVFGKDSASKHRASIFGSNEAGKAKAAAKKVGMQVLPIASDEQRLIAAKLPKGKLTAKGVPTVPPVKPALYQKILAMTGSPAEGAKPASAPPSSSSNSNSDDSQWNFKKGAEVLAVVDDESGWFEAIVQQVEGEVLTLKWEGWPDEPLFTRKVTQVAIRHPKPTRAW